MSQIGTVTYTTKDGDTIDDICWKYYGDDIDPIPMVQTANPGLADILPVFPAGIQIILPPAPTPFNVIPSVYLWS